MNDKRRKYAAVVFLPPELLDRDPTSTTRIEKELVYKLTDPIVKEAIKGECIVRFSETEQQPQEDFDLIESRKYVYIEEIVRCDKCRWHYEQGRDIVCAISKDAVRSDDYCSYGERRPDAD